MFYVYAIDAVVVSIVNTESSYVLTLDITTIACSQITPMK